MKCVWCETDSKYKDRLTGMCPRCGRPFAFEPRRRDPITDMGFQAAIDAVSANGQVRWGVEHLYYEICRRLRRGKLKWRNFAIVAAVLGIFSFVVAPGLPLLTLPAWLGFWMLLRKYNLSTLARLDQAEFDRLWKRWIAVHGEPEGLIVRKPQPAVKKVKEADIADYSFDRAVICDRARTVDLLIANNFHFENNCAILSIGGYPEGPFETVRTMLKRNPKLQVFALHDATVPGCKLAHKLANDANWFKNQVPVTDVGIRPGHAGPFKGLFLPASGLQIAKAEYGIREDEIKFLNSYILELAAIRPEQILKRLFRAINKKEGKERPDSDTDTHFFDLHTHYDDESFGTHAGDSDGGADSFG